ncbi:hypothetical protein [Clostridium sp.]|nr:hypothetical protein [Clostridium sp.]MDR3595532.1 hypothetical protein [Clostridium sp.]
MIRKEMVDQSHIESIELDINDNLLTIFLIQNIITIVDRLENE